MELGNMVFGHSRGSVSVDRGKWQDRFGEFMEAIGTDSYGANISNDVFEMRPYYWGDCTCGYDEKAAGWGDDHAHGPVCYQTELHRRMAEYEGLSGYKEIERRFYGGEPSLLANMETYEAEPGVFVSHTRTDAEYEQRRKVWSAAHDKRRKVEEALYRELCERHGLPYPHGCAVHCTCTHDQEWAEWSTANDHATECPLVLPNFLYRPTGYSLMWYKYPLRDAYANQRLTYKQFDAMLSHCETA
jgi:hypothetical protein